MGWVAGVLRRPTDRLPRPGPRARRRARRRQVCAHPRPSRRFGVRGRVAAGTSMDMPSLLLPTRRQAVGQCLVAAAAVVMCAGLLTTALLVRAPVAVTPLLTLVCVGCP